MTLRDGLGGSRGLRPGGAQFMENWGRHNKVLEIRITHLILTKHMYTKRVGFSFKPLSQLHSKDQIKPWI
ncbi:hypothetical protein Syun_024686 [Stephania yunnanensis]|uniref:Uncharacterized protein n=1 Tax=Stephania yunnanensis TaxID=152371 RepID=A0AAP0EQ79_9MAGN